MIADAEAAETAQNLIDLYANDADLDAPDGFLLKFGATATARFVAAGTNFNVGHNGAVDWSSVERLKLAEIKEA